jgi:hypothetical protein
MRGQCRMTKNARTNYPISRAVTGAAGLSMTRQWSFERNGKLLQLATRTRRNTGEYLVARRENGRTVTTERYRRYAEFVARVLALDYQLAEQRWRRIDVAGTTATRVHQR